MSRAGTTAKEADGPGQVLFRFVRHWSRRWNGTDGALAERGRDVWVTEAVHALAGRPETTVNDVATELGIDQSGASRLLTHAAGRGYVVLGPSPVDARRRVVALTPAGRELLRAAHDWQERVFDRLTADWTAAERRRFQHAMTRLLDRSADLTAD